MRRAAVLAVLMLTGCAETGPVVLDADYDVTDLADTLPPGFAGSLAGCDIDVEAKDDRLHPELLGMLDGRAVRGPADMRHWIGHALHDLTAFGAHVADAPGAAGDIGVRASLLMASVRSRDETLVADIVLKVSYVRDGALLRQAQYRGSDQAVVHGPAFVLNGAMSKILVAAQGDLAPLCREASTHPH